MDLSSKIEVLLFVSGEALSYETLEKTLGCTHKELESAVKELTDKLEGRGVELVVSDNSLDLVARKEAHDLVEKFTAPQKQPQLGQAALEVLAFVAYRGPVSKQEIDTVRGADSRSSIQRLLKKGLIERSSDDQYSLTTDALRFLGVSSKAELLDYESVHSDFERVLGML